MTPEKQTPEKQTPEKQTPEKQTPEKQTPEKQEAPCYSEYLASPMRYELFISAEAREQLRELSDDIRRNIGYRLQLLQDDLAGDLKKLEARRNHYRLRVGSHRILFRLDGARIEIYAVKQRKNVYE